MIYKSQYRNVYWYGRTGRWIVKIHMRGHPSGKETFSIGYYDDEQDAARVADVAEQMIRGPDAQLNFDGTPPLQIPRAVIYNRLCQLGIKLADRR